MVSSIERVSYELSNFYKGLEKDLYEGINLEYCANYYSMKYLTDQGVMMMTAALTIEENGDHQNLWFPFTKYVMERIIAKLDVPVVLIGHDAIPYANFLNEDNVYRVSPIKGVISEWNTEHTFLNVNRHLEKQGKESIMWLSIEPPF